MSNSYNYNRNEKGETVTFFTENGVFTAGGSHANFNQILQAVEDGDFSKAERLMNAATIIAESFGRLTERVSIAGNTLFFDGDPIGGALASEIVRLHSAEKDYKPLVRFMEKCAINPNSESVDQLYNWLTNNSFIICDDGDFLAYKGLYSTEEEGVLKSCSSGTAIVNGETVRGQVPQALGDVVEMPRSSVTFDPANGCGAGLHAGTKDYAEGYGNTMIMVKVNPRDVVSVPNDSQFQKLRVCRYTVAAVYETRYDDTLNEYGWFGDEYMDYSDDDPWMLFSVGHVDGENGLGFAESIAWDSLSPEEQDEYRSGYAEGRRFFKSL